MSEVQEAYNVTTIPIDPPQETWTITCGCGNEITVKVDGLEMGYYSGYCLGCGRKVCWGDVGAPERVRLRIATIARRANRQLDALSAEIKGMG